MLEARLSDELSMPGLTAEQLNRVSGAYFMRARVDIRHLDVAWLPIGGPIVAVGKHLCGCATDLGLTALRRGRVARVAIAICCHQLCTLADYPLASRAHLCTMLELEEEDLPAAFEIFIASSSWAVDGIDSAERFALRRSCKRLLIKAVKQLCGPSSTWMRNSYIMSMRA